LSKIINKNNYEKIQELIRENSPRVRVDQTSGQQVKNGDKVPSKEINIELKK